MGDAHFKTWPEYVLQGIEDQLGERPTSAAHLRRLEKKFDVERTKVRGAMGTRWI
jgi:hypothetical protein